MTKNLIYIVVFSIIIGVLAVWTLQRNTVYQSAISLWEDGFRKSPNKTRVLLNLATAYKNNGKTDLGMAAVSRALELDPDLITYFKFLDYARKEGATFVTEKDMWGPRRERGIR